MAAKVNSKFLIILASVLFVLFVGVAGLAYITVSRSGERYVKKGDEMLAQGKIKEATEYYGRAVGKRGGRSNKVWLEKWRDALVKYTPEDSLEYDKQLNFYTGILAALAEVEPTNPDPQLVYVSELFARMRMFGGQAEAMQSVIDSIGHSIERLDPEDPRTKKIIGIRGLAQLERFRRGVATDEEVAKALEDLKIGVANDPHDWDVAIGLSSWYLLSSERAAHAGRATDAEAHRAESNRVLNDFLAANPDQPEALVQQFSYRRGEVLRKAGTASDRAAVIGTLRADADKVLDQLLTAEPSKISANLLQFVRSVVPLDASSAKKYVKLCEKCVESDPTDPERLIALGQAYEGSGDFDAAVKTYQTVVDLPPVPISMRGLLLPVYRRIAVGMQVDTLVSRWDRTQDPTERAELLARAKDYRDRLAKLVDVRSQDMLDRRDATIALIEGRNDIALAKLSDLRAGVGAEDPDVLLPLGEVLYRMGNSGEARRIYEKLYKDGYTAPSLLMRLGELYLNDLQMTADARSMFEEILKIDPTNEAAKARLAQIAVVESGGKVDNAQDPVLAALVRSGEMRTRGELDESRKLLEDTYAKFPADRRILKQLLDQDIAENNRPKALQRVREAMAKAPDDAMLKRWEQFFAEEDPLKSTLMLIDSSEGTPLAKAIEKCSTYVRFSRFDEAKQALADAEKLDANDARVIEYGFLLALREKDYERARGYASRAAEKNVDQLGGLTYQGRLELAQAKYRDAVATFKKATDRIPERPELWRFYGQAQTLVGDIDGALKSFERAIVGRPNDIQIAKDYARALITVGRLSDALVVISPDTGVLRFGGGDDEAYNMWLNLEAQVGNRQLAIEKRRIVYKHNPKNIDNAMMFADLLITNDTQGEDNAAEIAKANKVEAAKVIEEVRQLKDVDPITIVNLEAKLLAESDNLEGASKKFRDYVDAIPQDKRSFGPYGVWARFLTARSADDEAEKVLTEAIKYQSPQHHEAERQLGDLFFDIYMRGTSAARSRRENGQSEIADEYETRARQFLEKARDMYKTAIDAGADSRQDGFTLSKRLAETYSRLGEHKKAEEMVQAMMSRVPAEEREKFAQDRELLLLRAQFAINAGDRRLARQIYDQAVEAYPTDPQPFLRRAVFLEGEPEDAGLTDALADLDRVHQLRPSMIEAWNLRFEWYRNRGRLDDAYTQLRKGIDANKANNDLKKFLVQNLMADGKYEDALAEAIRFANEDPNNMERQIDAARLAFQRGAWGPASALWERIYIKQDVIDPETKKLSEVPPVSALYYLESVVRRTDRAPDPKIVNPLLQRIESVKPQSARLLMVRARALNAMGDERAAKSLAKDAYVACEGSSRMLKQWFLDLVDLTQRKPWGAELLAEIEREPNLPPMIRIARFQAIHGAKSPQEQVAELIKLDNEIPSDDKLAKLDAARLGCRLSYVLQDFEQAARFALAGVAIDPNDGELNNNVAYLLVTQRKNPQEALPYAIKAADANATNSSALDTLGLIHLQLGHYRDAEAVLTRAMRTAQVPEETLPAAIHLAETYLKLADKENALKMHKAAQEAYSKTISSIQAIYKSDLDSLGQSVQ